MATRTALFYTTIFYDFQKDLEEIEKRNPGTDGKSPEAIRKISQLGEWMTGSARHFLSDVEYEKLHKEIDEYYASKNMKKAFH